MAIRQIVGFGGAGCSGEQTDALLRSVLGLTAVYRVAGGETRLEAKLR